MSLFNTKKNYIKGYIGEIYDRAPLTAEYKSHQDNYIYYMVPILNILSKYLEDEDVSRDVVNMNDLKKLIVTCFWIVNKFEDDYYLDCYDLSLACDKIIKRRELEMLEMKILKKIEYRLSSYIPGNISAYKKVFVFKDDVITPPHKLKCCNIDGKPPLYVKPRSKNISLSSNIMSIPVLPPTPPDFSQARKRPRSATY